MDLIILLVLLIVVGFFYKDFKNVVYFLGIVEIFFRLVHFIGDHLGVVEVNNVINKYLPSSILDILARYSSGLLYQILMWLIVICFIAFLVYLIKYFFKRK